MDLARLNVLVVGLGVSGVAAAHALLREGARVRVTEVSEGRRVAQRADELRAAGAEVEIGGHELDALDADLAVVSPGIPPTADISVALERAGIRTWSEVELAYRLGACDFLAVTGTNGKTTTTTLLANMLATSGIKSVAAGNIGLPLIEAVSKVPAGGAIAVEVSSFQLADIEEFRPRTACILNVAEDHTDWHGSIDGYVAAKARITENQTTEDFLIPNLSDPVAMTIAQGGVATVMPFSATDVVADGIGVGDEGIVFRGEEVVTLDEVPLPGRGGLEDVLGAAGSALAYGIPLHPVRAAIASFAPLRHRLEQVAHHHGVTFIDDSKATNPHATIAAVGGLDGVVLIAGGRSKGMDLSPLASLAPRLDAVVALGEATEELASLFEDRVPFERAGSMDEAVGLAWLRSSPGGSVLLSPGCASLDMYESYAHRGDDFARVVRDLIASLVESGKEGAAEGRTS